ncbi:hypothetical protein PMAYCL1PPCAC_14021, partial [Pristionchus mayeri]
RIVLFAAILQTVLSSCPAGFELVSKGECRGKYATVRTDATSAHGTAVSKCQEIQGQPIEIHDDEQETYWESKYEDDNGKMLLGTFLKTN